MYVHRARRNHYTSCLLLTLHQSSCHSAVKPPVSYRSNLLNYLRVVTPPLVLRPNWHRMSTDSHESPGRLPSPPLTAEDIELAALEYNDREPAHVENLRRVSLQRAMSSGTEADPLLLKSKLQTDEAVVRHRKTGKKAIGHFYSSVRTFGGDLEKNVNPG